jgi:hypothetical protein
MIFKGVDDNILIDCFEMLRFCEQRNSGVAIELKNKPFDQMYEQVMADKQ